MWNFGSFELKFETLPSIYTNHKPVRNVELQRSAIGRGGRTSDLQLESEG